MLNLLDRILRRKASATTFLDVRAVSGSQAVWTPKQFNKLIQEGYEQAVWVYACVGWLTRLARTVKWYVQVGDDERDDHPLALLMQQPNSEQSGSVFIEALYGYLLTSGNAYIERVGLENRPALELHVKRPDRMKVLPDSQERVAGYQYEVAGEKYAFERWQVRHLKTWAPLDDWYGLSPLAAAARGIDVFNAGMSHNLALMQNGARPSGAWVHQAKLSDQQFARLKSELEEQAALGRRGRPLLVEGGTSWVEMGMSPRDLDFLAGQSDAARQVHAAYGVHPVITGLTESTFENQAMALRGILVNAVLPFLDQLTDELNVWLAPAYGPNARLLYDRDAFPALSEDQESLWSRADIGWSKGIITRNEARAMVGYDELDPEVGNVFATDAAPMDLSGFMSSARDRITRAMNLGTPEAKSEYARSRLDLQLGWEEVMRAKLEDAFASERERVMGAIENASDADGLLAEVTESVNEDAWREVLQPLYLAALIAGGESVLDRLGKSARVKATPMDLARAVFGLFFQQTLDAALAHVAKLAGAVATTTLDSLRSLISDGARDGLSIPDIARSIDTLYLEDIIPNRSTVIARTETIRATNAGGQAAAKGTGLDLVKVWLATSDDRTRDEHLEANGQRVPLDSAYDVGGESLMYPGDPNGSAWNTIQCRCTEFYEERAPDEARSITPMKGGHASGATKPD